MRIWSIHPGYLDSKGLIALWRECLLAQNVLQGNTKGYKNHPQLTRFKNTNNPIGAIACYLTYVADEADRRGYNFNRSKIGTRRNKNQIIVTSGQVDYEFKHLLRKLKERDPYLYNQLTIIRRIKIHPIFKKIKGSIEEWEIL
ncbi:DNA-(apurinic or apyrimidinic site) lyase / pyrimidine dimer DNA glycosylase [Candidatus Scalindua japonica]|uniref:DNA-(Apurinic or apyrimidinic site) lyase / pyrimidine dimer DNA glycosylase n=1 Tax=Candidatus Scalindua japonica TaxID=1284222 RepID=A0A286U342_9BACT|nr:pyrimidine dimer DNA glycosylase/endonuclease V [Candidatus Scalindua japonica]GAX62554.1 DNA-(apurinic or apyrimidinic site) lyase / pyrimidine dimer DNA glycosylase [Candidatus Scalindua japonica]